MVSGLPQQNNIVYTGGVQPQQNMQGASQQNAPVTPQVMTYPQSTGAVTIQIFNPTTTNGAPMYPQTSYYMSSNAPYPYMPQGILNQQQSNSGNTNSNNVNITDNSSNSTNINTQPTQQNQVATKPNQDKPQKAEEKVKKALTDDYIKSLENYLNNENPKIRLMAIKEVLDRFKEDSSRADDKALIALMNKALQDTNSTIKYVALTILKCGYSVGNNETMQILKNIQADTKEMYSEDSLAASEVLLQLSHETKEVPKGVK